MKIIMKPHYLLIAFLVGFISLVYEIYSLKIIFFYFTESTHAISITLAAFLGGLAFSSLLFSHVAQKKSTKQKKNLLISLQIFSAIYALLILRNNTIIPYLLDIGKELFIGSPILFLIFKFTLIFIYLFIPAFLLGGAFPILNGLYQKTFENRYVDTGKVYFWDTIGAISGSLAAGFVIIPFFGLQNSLIVPMLLSIVVTIMLLTKRSLKTIISVALVLTLVIVFFQKNKSNNTIDTYNTQLPQTELIPYDSRFGDIVFQENSNYGVVTIGDRGGNNRVLHINYRDMCHTNYHKTESELARIALDNTLGNNLTTMNIGLGCGFTAEALAASDRVESVSIIEINKQVIEANLEFFGSYNNNIIINPKVDVFHENGTEVIRSNYSKKYDTIVIDIEEPSVIQSSPIYTVEYTQHVKRQLEEDGVYALWAIRGGNGNERYNQILYNTLKEVFDYVYIKYGSSVQLYAANRPLDIESDHQQWEDPSDEVNTLDNRVLEKSYNIYQVFDLPESYNDKFITD